MVVILRMHGNIRMERLAIACHFNFMVVRRNPNIDEQQDN